MYFVFTVAFFALLLGVAWWALRRALNGDHEPTAGGSFGDLALGDKNTRKPRAKRRN
jgi:hypothetical protein